MPTLQYKSKRPQRLNLRAATKSKHDHDPEREDRIAHCGICSKASAPNPQLCEHCQIWNDANHVFRCLKSTKAWDGLWEFTLADIDARDHCAMCRNISRAVVDRFVDQGRVEVKALQDARVQILGPFCLSPDSLGMIDPAFKRGSPIPVEGDSWLDIMHREQDPMKTASGNKIPAVLYVVLSAAPCSKLQTLVPELDLKAGTPESSRTFGSHRHTQVSNGLRQPTMGVQIELQYQSRLTDLRSVARWEAPLIDTAALRSCIESCDGQHGARCQTRESKKTLPTGFRVIDTVKSCVIEYPVHELPDYVALSYTWPSVPAHMDMQLGATNLGLLQASGSLTADQGVLSQIVDAMRLCSDLGQRYLWVDRLCIIQDDQHLKQAQIEAMDKIYTLAAFTVVAAVSAELGLPGVAGRPRHSSLWNHERHFHESARMMCGNFHSTVVESRWYTRCWTYQEHVLSRRTVYVTEFETYFSCNRYSEQEDVGEIALLIKAKDLHEISNYYVTVNQYLNRHLTYAGDILNAFAGIGNAFAGAQEAPFLYGLPERFFSQALLWSNAQYPTRRREASDIPTWSWAAWNGSSMYNQNSLVNIMSVGSLVEFLMQDPNSGQRPVQEANKWFCRKLAAESALPDVSKDLSEMRSVPSVAATIRDWTECVHSPWDPRIHDHDPEALALATAHPGSLVLTTTVATLRFRKLEGFVPSTTYQTTEVNTDRLEMFDEGDTLVGQATSLSVGPNDWDIRHGNGFEVAVLCAGIANEIVRSQRPQPSSHGNSHLHSAGDGEPWYLHVMVIERDQAGIAYRIGTGFVAMRAWGQCKPKWNTIVLR